MQVLPNRVGEFIYDRFLSLLLLMVYLLNQILINVLMQSILCFNFVLNIFTIFFVFFGSSLFRV